MDAVKVIISNDQKAVKVPTGIRMLISSRALKALPKSA